MPKTKIDIKYLDIPNICFSITGAKDKREKKFKEQRLVRGFDTSECWSLDITIAKFILPRLIEFKEKTIGTPTMIKTAEQWLKILSKMIVAFELISKENHISNDEENKKIQKGLDLFRKYYFSLWW